MSEQNRQHFFNSRVSIQASKRIEILRLLAWFVARDSIYPGVHWRIHMGCDVPGRPVARF